MSAAPETLSDLLRLQLVCPGRRAWWVPVDHRTESSAHRTVAFCGSSRRAPHRRGKRALQRLARCRAVRDRMAWDRSANDRSAPEQSTSLRLAKERLQPDRFRSRRLQPWRSAPACSCESFAVACVQAHVQCLCFYLCLSVLVSVATVCLCVMMCEFFINECVYECAHTHMNIMCMRVHLYVYALGFFQEGGRGPRTPPNWAGKGHLPKKISGASRRNPHRGLWPGTPPPGGPAPPPPPRFFQVKDNAHA